ncbi:MAG: hypothetical protein R3194_02615 [Limnobacter sp.]|nr:hypothetical protein [Limnobacter sp.]
MFKKNRIQWAVCLALVPFSAPLMAASEAEMQARIKQLEAELQKAKEELAEAKAKPVAVAVPQEDTAMDFDVAGGTLNVGGAVRVNYAAGTYAKSGNNAPSRNFSDGGNFALDTFRVNMDYTNGGVVGKMEYRFYNGYHFLHTGWLGYNYDDGSQVQVGVNRVPFGPGPYGVSQSFFFDQHYYLGFSDDMDLGVKYQWKTGDWDWAAAYYLQDEGSYKGSSKKADRYSYDIIPNNAGNGYEERNQVNFRGIYSTKLGSTTADMGFSVQAGQLEGQGVNNAGNPTQDGDMYAVSLHMINKWQNYSLASQITKYEYDVDQVGATRGEITAGAYAFPTSIAAEATIPAVSLSYNLKTPSIPWLNYVVPFVEYSTILKDEPGFNDSELYTIGAAFSTAGGWYTYAEWVTSDGNDFIGGDTAFGQRFGSNPDDGRQHRFNINFGYYF